MMEELNATMNLDIITAKAVQKIPEANCNGDMKHALEDVITAKEKHRDFMNTQGIAYMHQNN